MRIIADQQIPFVAEAFCSSGQVETLNGRDINAAVVVDADALLIRSVTRVNETLLKGSAVQFIGSATSGVDHVDLDYLQHNAITFVHAPGTNARSVAEYVLSCLYVIKATKATLFEGLTVGIIGHGHVGSRLHAFLKTLAVKCLIHDPPLKAKTNDKKYCEQDEIFQADVISLHVPFTSKGPHPTANMVNAGFLNQCKPNTILINTSRGGVVDEPALLQHLQAHSGFIAILDVWQHEPNINLALLKRVTLGTPHIAGYSLDAKVAATAILHNAFIQRHNLHRPAWSPPVANTHDNDDALCINRSQDPIQLSVLASYDVRRDSTALKCWVHMDRDRVHKGFDALRQNYPARREFTSKRITLNGYDHAQGKRLKDLGFRVTYRD